MSEIGVCPNCKHPIWVDVDGDGELVTVSQCTLKLVEKEIIETGKMDLSVHNSRHAFDALSGVMIRMCIGNGKTMDEIVDEMKISPIIVDWLIGFWRAVDTGMQKQHRPLYKSFRVTATSTTHVEDVFIGHGSWAPIKRDYPAQEQ
jgi:uncharacterized protein YbaR (Trm112 family)